MARGTALPSKLFRPGSFYDDFWSHPDLQVNYHSWYCVSWTECCEPTQTHRSLQFKWNTHSQFRQFVFLVIVNSFDCIDNYRGKTYRLMSISDSVIHQTSTCLIFLRMIVAAPIILFICKLKKVLKCESWSWKRFVCWKIVIQCSS